VDADPLDERFAGRRGDDLRRVTRGDEVLCEVQEVELEAPESRQEPVADERDAQALRTDPGEDGRADALPLPRDRFARGRMGRSHAVKLSEEPKVGRYIGATQWPFSMRISHLLLTLLPLALSLPGTTSAQATTNVPVQDLTYRHVERLIAEGLVDTVHVGQRPYSRREAARILAAALQ
jgi:hypothetical protein